MLPSYTSRSRDLTARISGRGRRHWLNDTKFARRAPLHAFVRRPVCIACNHCIYLSLAAYNNATYPQVFLPGSVLNTLFSQASLQAFLCSSFLLINHSLICRGYKQRAYLRLCLVHRGTHPIPLQAAQRSLGLSTASPFPPQTGQCLGGWTTKTLPFSPQALQAITPSR